MDEEPIQDFSGDDLSDSNEPGVFADSISELLGEDGEFDEDDFDDDFDDDFEDEIEDDEFGEDDFEDGDFDED